ncbi:glucose dehydrogenase [Mesorhizobium sanjuanii]|uniref:Glucose dehydrogenase n=1 Tax=Mesorhizobium sanjuanii TaxID=2037900 RepID=A0A2A6FJ37_9HYPH|nr:PQQ-dependent sugar dehydrogenase [Mesorhizobium sanjuanii]PDQ21745.1 glucose dehydrogenase [Mesorhizobium sanjuanii]
MRNINQASLAGHRQSWSIASRAAIVSIIFAVAGNASAQDFNLSPPNAVDQKPAFAGQTRAPVINDSTQLISTVVAEGLENPWGMAELPDGGWLVTERPGRMRLVRPEGTVSEPIQGVPEVVAQGQGGLLDVAVRDDFNESRRVWWSFSQPRGAEGSATAVATGVLSADGAALSEVRVVFQQQPAWRSNYHFGSRLVFDRDGALFVTTGERGQQQLAQDVGTHLGKVIRINPDGGVAPGNPQIEGALPEIWSFGHRNMQAAALGPDGALWTIEHGPRGGDELNRPQPGKNYGWPIVTYGEAYSGAPIGEGITAQDGMEQPIYYWDPVIAPSGMAFYDGSMFPEWRGSILVGGLSSLSLVRLTLSAGRVTGEARYLEGTGRIRDVAVARDGSIMLLTDDGGQVLRLTRGS